MADAGVMRKLALFELVGLESRLVCFRIPCRLPVCRANSTTMPEIDSEFSTVDVPIVDVAVAPADDDAEFDELAPLLPPPPTSTNFDGRFVQNTGFE